jgi:hypothetical protein
MLWRVRCRHREPGSLAIVDDAGEQNALELALDLDMEVGWLRITFLVLLLQIFTTGGSTNDADLCTWQFLLDSIIAVARGLMHLGLAAARPKDTFLHCNHSGAFISGYCAAGQWSMHRWVIG